MLLEEEGMSDVVVELKKLMALTGVDIAQGLKALLNDTNSALSRTLGKQLNERMSKQNELRDSNS